MAFPLRSGDDREESALRVIARKLPFLARKSMSCFQPFTGPYCRLLCSLLRVPKAKSCGPLQVMLHDVRIQKQAMDVLGCYHPFWLQQAVELIVRKRAPVSVNNNTKWQNSALSSFVAEHFLADAELAQDWAVNRGINGLFPPQYWVSHPSRCLAQF